MKAKVPLVLLPGLLLDGRLWQAQIAGLAVLAEVSIGDLTRGETIAAMAEDVLAAAPERFALAGLSLGGYVALAIAAQAPARVTRLALIATSARPDTAAQRARRQALMRLARHGRFQGVTPRLLPYYVHADRLEDRTVTEPVLAMAKTLGREVFLRQTAAVMARADARPRLAAIACPTLVLCGREDRATPMPLSFEIAESIPGADLVVLGRCGHLPPSERPRTTTALLRGWLTR